MERHIAAEVQINSELVTNPSLREDVLYLLALVLLRAGGHTLHPVLVARDRIVVQAPRKALEEAAQVECPEALREGLVAFFDVRI